MKQFTIVPLVLLSLVGNLSAQPVAERKVQYNLEKSGLAIQGYDPIAYFTSNKAVEGREEFATEYNGVTYRFSTAHNRDVFRKDPSKYEPQYGGWCAYAMGSTGEKVEIDPETFKVTGGRLYLFYNKLFTNTLPMWNKDEARLRTNADKNWEKFVK